MRCIKIFPQCLGRIYNGFLFSYRWSSCSILLDQLFDLDWYVGSDHLHGESRSIRIFFLMFFFLVILIKMKKEFKIFTVLWLWFFLNRLQNKWKCLCETLFTSHICVYRMIFMFFVFVIYSSCDWEALMAELCHFKALTFNHSKYSDCCHFTWTPETLHDVLVHLIGLSTTYLLSIYIHRSPLVHINKCLDPHGILHFLFFWSEIIYSLMVSTFHSIIFITGMWIFPKADVTDVRAT